MFGPAAHLTTPWLGELTAVIRKSMPVMGKGILSTAWSRAVLMCFSAPPTHGSGEGSGR